VRKLRESFLASDGRHADDSPPTLLFHRLLLSLTAEKNAFGVDIIEEVPVFPSQLSDGLDADHTGVVHRDVELAEFFHGLIDRPLNLVPLGHASLDRHCPAPHRPHIRRHLFRILKNDVGHRSLKPIHFECLTQTAIRARHP